MPARLQCKLFEKELGLDTETAQKLCFFTRDVMIGSSYECKEYQRDVLLWVRLFFDNDVVKMFAFLLKLMKEKETKPKECWPVFSEQYTFMENNMIWH